ncbi:hypothetical protein K2Z84_32045 [Candidatus Binatia bacterium]|nr:hypothetical protein [Candidatus Binatia bacterium]
MVDEETEPAERRAEPTPADDWKKPWWLEYVGAAGVAVALCTAIYNGCNTRQQLALTRKSLALSQRPWVVMDRLVGDAAIDLTREVKLNGDWTNVGQGPARYVRTFILPVRSGANAPFPNVWDYSPASEREWKSVNGILGPRSRIASPANFQLSDEERDSIMSGAELLRIIGFAYYADVFGSRHWTTTCWVYRTTWNRFDLCEAGNDTDD